mgnify:CR=1 FL=1
MQEYFDWEFYVNFHTDLREAGINTEEKAVEHYQKYGVTVPKGMPLSVCV